VGEQTVSYSNDTGYLAIPPSGSGPAVIVIDEHWGPVPHIRSIADRFAAAGFVAFAPDLAAPDLAAPGLPAAGDASARLVAGTADELAARPEVTGRVGTVGFGAGGTLALLAAAESGRLVAAAAFYPDPAPASGPTGYAGKKVVVHCADGGVPGVRPLVDGIRAAGGEVVTYTYPGTAPAFFNDDRPEVYDRRAAALAWARTLELLRRQL